MISANELEKYCYCPLSWWLSRQETDFKDDELKKGEKKHAELSKELQTIKFAEQTSKESEVVVLWFAIGATVISLTGISFLGIPFADRISWILAVTALVWLLTCCIFLYKASVVKDGRELRYSKLVGGFAIVATVVAVNSITILSVDYTVAWVAEFVAVLWLIGANFFLHHAIVTLEAAKRKRSLRGIVGDVKYIDAIKGAEVIEKPKLFVSEEYGLCGRPDYILKVDDEYVPVEFKSGRTPTGPLFSHILQVAAYCFLLKSTGLKCEYGILKYGATEHEIEYTDELHNLLSNKLREMEAAKKSGVVHRNHKRIGKCRKCSRRAGCPEKLV